MKKQFSKKQKTNGSVKWLIIFRGSEAGDVGFEYVCDLGVEGKLFRKRK